MEKQKPVEHVLEVQDVYLDGIADFTVKEEDS